MLEWERCMETWVFGQSSCWKYYRLVVEIWTQSIGGVLKYTTNKNTNTEKYAQAYPF